MKSTAVELHWELRLAHPENLVHPVNELIRQDGQDLQEKPNPLSANSAEFQSWMLVAAVVAEAQEVAEQEGL